jgi:hypothetical protein
MGSAGHAISHLKTVGVQLLDLVNARSLVAQIAGMTGDTRQLTGL